MKSPRLERDFPNLRSTAYEVKSEEDEEYNCIAWAANVKNRMIWWWPNTGYWPREPENDASVQEFMEVLRAFLGYEVCATSDLEKGCEKVALYVDHDGEPQHMARQLPSGRWTSKCGDLEDIEHELSGLEGDLYGKATMFLKRKAS